MMPPLIQGYRLPKEPANDGQIIPPFSEPPWTNERRGGGPPWTHPAWKNTAIREANQRQRWPPKQNDRQYSLTAVGGGAVICIEVIGEGVGTINYRQFAVPN